VRLAGHAGHEFQRPMHRVLVAAALAETLAYCMPGTDILKPQVFTRAFSTVKGIRPASWLSGREPHCQSADAPQRHCATDMAGTPGSGRSIFPRAPSFTIETFSNKDFIVKDFIESLTDSAIPVNRRSGGAQQVFDPKPLIRSFESMARYMPSVHRHAR
jgi:hypothetical protein